jgi:hypothetical protein
MIGALQFDAMRIGSYFVTVAFAAFPIAHAILAFGGMSAGPAFDICSVVVHLFYHNQTVNFVTRSAQGREVARVAGPVSVGRILLHHQVARVQVSRPLRHFLL